jgi:hypothetical protein
MTIDELPPVMRALFAMLPPPDSEWPRDERLRWLRAFETVCRLIYKDDVRISIDPIVPVPAAAPSANVCGND